MAVSHNIGPEGKGKRGLKQERCQWQLFKKKLDPSILFVTPCTREISHLRSIFSGKFKTEGLWIETTQIHFWVSPSYPN